MTSQEVLSDLINEHQKYYMKQQLLCGVLPHQLYEMYHITEDDVTTRNNFDTAMKSVYGLTYGQWQERYQAKKQKAIEEDNYAKETLSTLEETYQKNKSHLKVSIVAVIKDFPVINGATNKVYQPGEEMELEIEDDSTLENIINEANDWYRNGEYESVVVEITDTDLSLGDAIRHRILYIINEEMEHGYFTMDREFFPMETNGLEESIEDMER